MGDWSFLHSFVSKNGRNFIMQRKWRKTDEALKIFLVFLPKINLFDISSSLVSEYQRDGRTDY